MRWSQGLDYVSISNIRKQFDARRLHNGNRKISPPPLPLPLNNIYVDGI